MADDNTIIEGTVKFRDGKKWKSRWCVMRKLSPVADCVHLQLYRDWRARCAGASSKASLSLQQFLGSEAGFTLDKHSNTLALVCKDFVAILAFETRERLIQWQVKVSSHLGEPRHYLVLVGGGGRLAAGPARLHLQQQRCALTAGVPPRLLGVWELPHLRRYGVVEGRFCFEGGSHCGKGEGLHVLITDQAHQLARDFDLASQGRLSPKRRPLNAKKNESTESPKSNKAYRPDTRLSELNTIDRSLPPLDLRLYEDSRAGEEAGAISPFWPSAERTNLQDLGLADTASVNETVEGTDTDPWSGTGNVTLERCMSCMSKLGALSRSSTAALTPGAKHFNPAWTMEAVPETPRKDVLPNENTQSCDINYKKTNKTEELCRCSERPPDRPPKPTRLELNLGNKPPMPLPSLTCSCAHIEAVEENKSSKIGPYENYDVPRLPSAEVEGEYYDTPKRLKECLNNELFRITKSSTGNSVILKKPCGCLLKFGRRPKRPTIVDTDENVQPANCPCRRVTDWANNWIKLPYCRKNTTGGDQSVPNKENLKPNTVDRSALYATIDFTRKTRRKSSPGRRSDNAADPPGGESATPEVDDGPLANYENLNFALSLEHYENAKDLLRRAGVTRPELDAIAANLRAAPSVCAECGHPPTGAPHDDYLVMGPEAGEPDRARTPPPGYAPMSPIGGFAFHTLRHPPRSPNRALESRSASHPALGGGPQSARGGRGGRQRASSADSSRFLEDVAEFASSTETLRDAGPPAGLALPPSSTPSRRTFPSTPAATAPNRDSSSSNDSGVSSCSRAPPAGPSPPPWPRRSRSARRAPAPSQPPRRCRSGDAPRRGEHPPAKSASAEAEVPVLLVKPLRGVVDTHSTSSGTSDMSDYIETLSICSSHSSSDAPVTLRVVRQTTSTLRPRSGKEYQNLDPRLTSVYRAHPRLYTDLP